MQSPRHSIDRSDSQSPTCSALEDSILTLDASTASLKDLSLCELNEGALSLSKIITDSEEEAESGAGECSERCEDFHALGYCLRGVLCGYEHRTTRPASSVPRTASSLLINFPEIIVAAALRRTRSFLQ